MKRILQIVSYLKKNGTETFVMNLFRNLNHERFMFDFLVFSSEKEGYYDEIISMGAKIYFLPTRREGIMKYHKGLDEFFCKHAHDYDAIHWHGSSFSSISSLVYAKKYSIPIRVVHCHNSGCSGFHNKILHSLNKHRVGHYATHYLACSNLAKEWGYSGTSTFNRAVVIPNGINLNDFIYSKDLRNQIRKEEKIENKFVIIHVGTFNQIKNHSFLLNYFKDLLPWRPNSTLICIGDGPLLESSKKLAANLGISEFVKFIGRKDNVTSYYSAADIMIFPSHHEGFGLVALEAAATGLPVIASTGLPKELGMINNISFLSLNTGTGLWVKKTLELTGRNGLDRLERNNELTNYSIQDTVNKIENIYGSI